jgi:hypothetical protein
LEARREGQLDRVEAANPTSLVSHEARVSGLKVVAD